MKRNHKHTEISMKDEFAGFSISGRSVTIGAYDMLAKPLLDYVKRLDLPWMEDEELKASIARLRATLESIHRPFVGLVVSIPPPKQKAPMDGMSLGHSTHGEQFCDWFGNLHLAQVEKVTEGTTAYRFLKVMPYCRVEKVTFYTAAGWLSRKEVRLLKKQGYLKAVKQLD